jgi:hypothetical protein
MYNEIGVKEADLGAGKGRKSGQEGSARDTSGDRALSHISST